jgi:hypothetical protein
MLDYAVQNTVKCAVGAFYAGVLILPGPYSSICRLSGVLGCH